MAVPLSWPGFLTVGLVVALSVWNEFLLAIIFLSKEELFTVVSSFYNFQTRFGRDWGLPGLYMVAINPEDLIPGILTPPPPF